jgi:hypothetical protein
MHRSLANDEYLPALQTLQVVAASQEVYDPALHSVHSELAEIEKCPAGQAAQTVNPEMLAYVPALHGAQNNELFAFTAEEKVPSLHFKH